MGEAERPKYKRDGTEARCCWCGGLIPAGTTRFEQERSKDLSCCRSCAALAYMSDVAREMNEQRGEA
jgi:hypothetical protein